MKTVIAMSGGVDSSVAALLLKQRGHHVIGISLRLTEDSLKKQKGRCCSFNDLSDARQICNHLNIPFYVIDLQKKFKETVIKPFVQTYKNGQTPIPCIPCNDSIKFGYLYKIASNLGAKLATGHYAKIVNYKGILTISKPKDNSRDQTYYLYGINPNIIQNLYFPLGELYKKETREMAKLNGLKVFDKTDSNEICFVPDGKHAKIVEKYSKKIPTGNFVNTELEIISKHNGIHNFTIGQRRGLGINGTKHPLYVADINPISRDIIVSNHANLYCSKIKIGKVNTLVPMSMWPEIIYAQIRSQHKSQKARWLLCDNELYFEFFEPIFAVALGQALVVYDENVLLGGGTITGRLDGFFPRISKN